MKKLATRFLLTIFVLATAMSIAAYAADDSKDKQKQVTIQSCFSISDAIGRKLCQKEQAVRAARRTFDVLAAASEGGSTHGGASDCAAAAEADCNSTLEDVETIDYDGKTGICKFTCMTITPPSGGRN